MVRNKLFQYLDKYDNPSCVFHFFSVKPHLTPEEYKETEHNVREFGNTQGKYLHEKLLEKASTSRNWVSLFCFYMYLYFTVKHTGIMFFCFRY